MQKVRILALSLSLAVALSASVASATTTIGANISTGGNLTVTGTSTLGIIDSGIWNGTSIGDAYIDDDITASNYLLLGGGTMSGSIDMGGNDLNLNNGNITNGLGAYFAGNVGIGSAANNRLTVRKDDYGFGNGEYTNLELAGNDGLNIDVNDPTDNMSGTAFRVNYNDPSGNAIYVASANNILYGQSNAITGNSMISLSQDTSAFSGDGLNMNFNNGGSGSFSGNYLNFLNNGVQQFYVSNSGSINTQGSLTLQGVISIPTGSPIWMGADQSFGFYNDGTNARIITNDASDRDLIINTGVNNSVLFDGMVGVGTTTPDRSLVVNGNVLITGTLDAGTIAFSGADISNVGNLGMTGGLNMQSANQLVMGSGTSFRLWDDDSASHIITNDDSSRDLIINTGASNFVTMDGGLLATGFVGIGTTTPDRSLVVDGNVLITGSLDAASIVFSGADINNVNNLSINNNLTVVGTSTLSNVLLGGAINGLTFASSTDGFTIAGGDTSRTLTITGGNITFTGDVGGTSALTLPATGVLATLDGSETFTNKTLTSPAISGGTIDDAVIGGVTSNAGTFTTLTANTSLTIGGGTAILGHLSAIAVVDFASMATSTCNEQTITVTGALTENTVNVGAPAGVEAGLVWSAFVSATDTVTIRACNIGGTDPLDPASATWRADVWKH